jgi:hypothetical protein
VSQPTNNRNHQQQQHQQNEKNKLLEHKTLLVADLRTTLRRPVLWPMRSIVARRRWQPTPARHTTPMISNRHVNQRFFDVKHYYCLRSDVHATLVSMVDRLFRHRFATLASMNHLFPEIDKKKPINKTVWDGDRSAITNDNKTEEILTAFFNNTLYVC